MTSNLKELDKFKMQDSEYDFPYHYIPHFESSGIPKRSRDLRWGLEYLCYLKHIEEIIIKHKPNSLLDVGCGTGRFIGMIKHHINRLVGVDLSENAIKFAQAFHQDIEFQAVNANVLKDEFDAVTAIEVLEHIPDEFVSEFFQTLSNRCKKGGMVIISVPTKVLPVAKKHYRHYDIELFREELNKSGAKLDIINVEHVYRKSKFASYYRAFMCNRYWSLEFAFMQKSAWNFVWNKLRIASKKDGLHLIVTLIKE